ncbi:hypothetical protein CLIB1444_01S02102 [[Candida] jaroonii]|uniref:Uncharacterized protein n=1 Tax=[Candida] jaroonii TaxID=467808 RepID=A0ACA9Y003_9ASCO|nr:hypothetical protein CLIB1444_01S02102 [[Candida] jaroonii]
MESETIQFYRTIFDDQVKDDEYYHSFYSVTVSVNGLKSIIKSNLQDQLQNGKSDIVKGNSIQIVDDTSNPSIDGTNGINGNDSDHGKLEKIEIIKKLIKEGIKLYGEAIEIPQIKDSPSTISEDLEEEDITNIGKRKDSVKSVNSINFNQIDENLRLEYIVNVLKILRILILSIDNIQIDEFLSFNQWFLIKLLPNFDMPQIHQSIIVIVKEIIYFVYDVVMKNKNTDLKFLKKYEFSELFNDVLVKTNAKLHEDVMELPVVKLSVESKIKLFMVIGILGDKLKISNVNQLFLQFESMLLYNLKLSFEYSSDLVHYQIMNGSFFHWMTGNILNFQDQYINDKFINRIDVKQPKYVNNEELCLVLDNRLKECKLKNLENFEIRELLPISLYVNAFLDNEDFLKTFIVNDNFFNWLCLLSYSFQYQYKIKSSILMTRLSILMINKLMTSEDICNIRIDECKWKLCHQKNPIVSLSENPNKLVSSYILDMFSILLRFNLNKKLNTINFINSIKLVHIIISKQVDEEFEYIELFKIIINLLNFNEQFLHNDDLTFEILQLSNNLLTLNIRFELIYEILLNFNKFYQIKEVENFPNLMILKVFLSEKFDLEGSNDENKIRPADLDYDSVEFIDTIELFDGDLTLLDIPKVQLDIKDIVKNI